MSDPRREPGHTPIRVYIEAEFKLPTLSVMGEADVRAALREFKEAVEYLATVTRAEIVRPLEEAGRGPTDGGRQ